MTFADEEIAEEIETWKQPVGRCTAALASRSNPSPLLEDQEMVDRKVLGRAIDVCERRDASLGGRNEGMRTYIDRANRRVTAGGRRDDR